jgi:hypothetical protein
MVEVEHRRLGVNVCSPGGKERVKVLLERRNFGGLTYHIV